jgi:hypothetical protein
MIVYASNLFPNQKTNPALKYEIYIMPAIYQLSLQSSFQLANRINTDLHVM